MRHRVSGKKLNRDVQHRRGLYKNLITALITNGRIETTQAKAKAVQGQVDKLITTAKKGQLHHRRQIDKKLNSTALTHQLVDKVAKDAAKRTSGYTRIVKLGRRRGDATMIVRLELVDFKATAAKDAVKKADKKPKKSGKKESKSKSQAPKQTAPMKETAPASATAAPAAATASTQKTSTGGGK